MRVTLAEADESTSARLAARVSFFWTERLRRLRAFSKSSRLSRVRWNSWPSTSSATVTTADSGAKRTWATGGRASSAMVRSIGREVRELASLWMCARSRRAEMVRGAAARLGEGTVRTLAVRATGRRRVLTMAAAMALALLLASSPGLHFQRPQPALRSSRRPSVSLGSSGVGPTHPSESSAYVRAHVRKIYGKAISLMKKKNLHDSRALLTTCIQLDERDARSWLALARLEADAGHRKASLDAIDNGLRKCPGNVHLMHAGAVLEHKAGNLDAARRRFEEARAEFPENTYLVHSFGMLLSLAGNVTAARALYLESVQAQPTAAVCSAWAALEGAQGNAEEARSLWAQAVSLYNPSTEAHKLVDGLLAWSDFELSQGHVRDAHDLASEALQVGVRQARCHVKLAQLEDRMGDRAAARAQFEAAVGSSDADTTAYNLWASWERRMGNLREALRILRQGCSRFPRDAAVLFQSAGTMHERLGNEDAARKLYQKSARARPRAAAYVAWARLEEGLGHFDECRRLYKLGRAAEPGHGALHNAYASFEERRGNVERARTIFARASKTHPVQPDVWHGWGGLELRQGNVERAKWLWRRGTQSHPDSAYLWNSLGSLEHTAGNLDAAEAAFGEGLKRNRDSSVLLLGMARINAARGEPNRARAFFRRSVEAEPGHAHAWHAWSCHEKAAGDMHIARVLLGKGLAQIPGNGVLWDAAGRLEVERGNSTGARALFRLGSQHDPTNTNIVASWAKLELAEGRVSTAEDMLRAALDTHPRSTDGPLFELMIDAQLRKGDRAAAEDYFQVREAAAKAHRPAPTRCQPACARRGA